MAKLFKNNIISEKLQTFLIPDFEEKISILKSWENLYKTQKLHNKKEEELEGPFGDDFFGKILGYRSLSENEIYNRKFQPKVLQGGQKADLGLGFFASEKEIMKVVIELKDSKTSLDKPQQRAGNLTPVQQAFKYKPYFKECDFVIVSNFYETRLYIDSYYDFEVWTLTDLVDEKEDYYNFRVFYYLLCKENLIREQGDSNTKSLLSIIRTQEKEITKKFYSEYSNLRKELFKDIIKHNSFKKSEVSLALNKTQTIIDRIIFIHFCEDLGLLPCGKLNENILKAGEIGFTPWDVLKVFFRGVDRGSEKLGIPNGYNGGLFREDKELDKLVIGDDICKKFVDLGEYDFANDLSVNILGHIFEQSISDIEEIKSKINLNEEEKTVSKRKKDGIFYTPEYIVDYIVKNSVGKKIDEWEDELKEKHNLKEEITDKNYEKRAIIVYSELQEKVQNIKVLDPACGSGAFLVKVFDFLLEKNKEIAKKLEDLTGSISMQKEDDFKNILQNNIYGVDLNEESVEITKLSLWLRTASKGKKLANLDSNIKCGNSLIDDESVAGDKAFKWEKEFPFCHSGLDSESRGFDLVVGNPPYIEIQKLNSEDVGFLRKNYETAKSKNIDIYIAFYEKGLKLLKQNGILSYITPNRFLNSDYGELLLNFLGNYNIIKILNFRHYLVFEDADTYTLILSIQNSKQKEKIEYLELKRLYNTNNEEANLIINNLENISVISPRFKKEKFWYLMLDKERKVFDKCNKIGNEFKNFCEVNFQGLITSFDDFYILKFIKNLDSNTGLFYSKYLKLEIQLENNLLLEIISNPNVKNYIIQNESDFILFPYKNGKLLDYNFIKQNYPNIYEYFEKAKQDLQNREKGSFKGPDFYRYGRTQNLDKQDYKKLLIPHVTKAMKCAFDKNGDYAIKNVGVNGITLKDEFQEYYKYLLCLLNSKLLSFILSKISIFLAGGFYASNKQFAEKLPIKNISLPQQQPFIEKADFMLTKNKELQEKLNSSLEFLKNRFVLEKINQKLEKFYELDFIEFKKALNIKKISMSDEEDLMNWFKTKKQDLMSIKTQIDECDKEIDNMVFDLYGLNEEERKVVLGS